MLLTAGKVADGSLHSILVKSIQSFYWNFVFLLLLYIPFWLNLYIMLLTAGKVADESLHSILVKSIL